MTAAIGGITSKVVEFALDGLAMRHQAIALNIANANSVGYRPVQVSFESLLSGMLASRNDFATSADTDFKPQFSYGTPMNSATSENSLEMNTVMLNQNVVQYETLIKGLDKYMNAISIAINEGRR